MDTNTRDLRADRLGETLISLVPDMSDAAFERFLAALPHSSIDETINSVAYEAGAGSNDDSQD